MRKNPCHGCEERTPTCHSTCQKYIDWRKDHEEERKKIRQEKELEWAITDNRMRATRSAYRRKR